MSRVFFTSDLHFGHYNLCVGLRQMSTEESDELIIKNWNSVVNKQDIVYVLGDIVMEKPKIIEQYLNRLHGSIRVVGGNHDNLQCCKVLQSLGIPVMGVLQYKGFLCTHIPIHPTQLITCKGNIHGHVHLNGILMPDGSHDNVNALGNKYYNVNIELHNYTPILFDQIVQDFQSNINTR